MGDGGGRSGPGSQWVCFRSARVWLNLFFSQFDDRCAVLKSMVEIVGTSTMMVGHGLIAQTPFVRVFGQQIFRFRLVFFFPRGLLSYTAR